MKTCKFYSAWLVRERIVRKHMMTAWSYYLHINILWYPNNNNILAFFFCRNV